MSFLLLLLFFVTLGCCSSLEQWIELRQDGPPVITTEPNATPLPRRQHAAWCLNDDVWIFGGKTNENEISNEMWKFEGETGRWIWQPNGPFQAHGMAYWSIRDEFYFYKHAELWKFKPTSREWEKITNANITSSNPGELTNELVFWSDPIHDRLFLYGGKQDQDQQCIYNMWSFNILELQWVNHNTNSASPHPFFCNGGATTIEDKTYAYSTVENDNNNNVLWELDLNTNLWREMDGSSSSSSSYPSTRTSYTLFPSPTKDALLLHGGKQGSQILGDFWKYDLNSREWKEITKGSIPSRRWGASHCIDYESATIIQGGGEENEQVMHNDVWRFGGNRPRGIDEFFKNFNADAVTLSSTIGGVCSMLILIGLIVVSVIACVAKIRKRRKDRKGTRPVPLNIHEESNKDLF